jgi:amino acid transporter
MRHREYALAEVVKPQMGHSGVVLVSLIALMATSSAINATLFGASRILEQMSCDKVAPRSLGMRSRADVPAFAIIALTFLSIVLTLLGGLDLIVAFSSLTFLIVSIGVSIANFRLRAETGCYVPAVLLGIILMSATSLTLCYYLWRHEPDKLVWIVVIYAIVLLPNLMLGPHFRRRNNHG